MTKRYLVSGILVLTLAACANPLDVSNLNDPDRTRTFSNAQDLQVFIAGLYAVAHQATLGAQNDGLQTQMAVMSMENVSGLANFAMGPRSSLPRNPITNQRGRLGRRPAPASSAASCRGSRSATCRWHTTPLRSSPKPIIRRPTRR